MQMGHNSQIALTLGRRPRAIATARGTQTLASSTVCPPTIRTITARSAPCWSFRKVAFLVTVVINILAPEKEK